MTTGIDRRDGAVDGRIAKSLPGRCPRCNRALERTACNCGQAIAWEPFER